MKVGFKVPKMNCTEVGTVPWQDIVEDEKEKMTTSMTCTIDYATDCKPKVSEKCSEVKYMECNELPRPSCDPSEKIKKPDQIFEHKKKCLLPDDGSIRKFRNTSKL